MNAQMIGIRYMKENMEEFIPSAFNGLMYLSTFREAFKELDDKTRVSIEHMETFFFMCTVFNQEGVELRHLQEQLGYPQAKMHRTADTLMQIGWFEIEPSPTDARQKVVSMTDKGMRFFARISKYLHPERPKTNTYEEKTYELSGLIKYEAEQKANVTNAKSDEKWAKTIKSIIKRVFGAEPEIGAGYIKVKPNQLYQGGIITLPVLMKRAYVTSTDDLASYMYALGKEQLVELLSPTPKGIGKVADPAKAMADMIAKYGVAGIGQNPQLRVHYHQLASQIVKDQKEKTDSAMTIMEKLNKRRAVIMSKHLENTRELRKINKQLSPNYKLMAVKIPELKKVKDMLTYETKKLNEMLDDVNQQRTKAAEKINDNLSKGIGSLVTIEDRLKYQTQFNVDEDEIIGKIDD